MLKFYLILPIAIYFLGCLVGYSLIQYDVEGNFDSNYLDGYTIGKSPTFYTFLYNNFLVIFFVLAGFGLLTFVNLISNGVIFGSIIKNSVIVGLSYWDILSLALPHGIFEIPAIIIAGAAGFKIPYEITKYLAGKKENVLTKQDIKEYLTLASISIILIVIAAWIEANITLRIAESILSSGG